VEDNEVLLSSQAVAYLNLDSALGGIENFNVASAPPLVEMIYAATKDVNVNGTSLYEFWNASGARRGTYRPSPDTPAVEMLGSGSDFTAFQHHLGICSADFSFRSDHGYPVYHSRFDTAGWYEKFGDPTFEYSQVMARFIALLTFRLASVQLLPFTYKPYSAVLQQGLELLKQRVRTRLGESLYNAQEKTIALLEKSVMRFVAAVQMFEDSFDSLAGKEALGFGAGEDSRRQMNDRLMLVERAFLSGPGLPGRPWFKHLIFAPEAENQYEGAIFPGVIDTLAAVSKDGQDLSAESIAKELGGPIRAAAQAVNNARKFLIHPLGGEETQEQLESRVAGGQSKETGGPE
jgi:N-acetylated-alpha-linked acidic dipeptidase